MCWRQSSRLASSATRAATARNGRSRSKTWSTAWRIWKWHTTPTTASSCDGAHRNGATRRPPVSGMHRQRSVRRWQSIAPGSKSGTGRRTRSRQPAKCGPMRDSSQSGLGRNGGRRFVVADWILAAAGLVMLAAAAPLLAQDQLSSALDALVAAYPKTLAGHDVNALRWRDGTAMPVSVGAESKTFTELLKRASIADEFRIAYPRGPLEKPPAVDADPGRYRNTAFFTKMYGDCQMGTVAPHLV